MPVKNFFPIFNRLKPGAYSYVWTEKCEQLLPKHYKARCLEYMLKDPAPVHYRPNPQKYTYDRYGTRKPVQNHPIEVRFPVQCNKGLWGGEGIVEGMVKKMYFGTRVPKLWVPKIYNRPLYSEILDKWFTIPVTMRAMEMIDEAFGLDNYILGTHERDLNSKLGMDLRRTLLIALAKKSIYPDDPEKREKILKKYEKYTIPLEEAEWVGLSIEEALQKVQDIQDAKPVIPLKEYFKQDLLEHLQYHIAADKESNKLLDFGKVKRVLSPFKDKEDKK